MNGIQSIQAALESTQFVLKWFLEGFSDADMLVRPVPGANHAAWQVGNVIVGDKMLVEGVLPDASYPDLPPDFVHLHGPEGAKQEGPEGFLTKSEYLDLFDSTRAATIATLNALNDSDLDRPSTGDIAQFAPTLGHLFLLVSNHTLLHVGQFSVIRRMLGKPILF